MKKNLEILRYSIYNPENFFDIAYSKRGRELIISVDPETPNFLQKQVAKLRNCITVLDTLTQNNLLKAKQEKHYIHTIIDILDNTVGINFSEFVSYWSVNDVSFSGYKNMPYGEKYLFVKDMISYYCADRDIIYKKYGYTDVSLQSRADSAGHKASGELGLRKVAQILNDLGFSMALSESDFLKNPFVYLKSDKSGKKIATEIIKNLGIKFDWKIKHEGKNPDFLIKINKRIIILEHKHVKETGGGQDKQMSEMISLIESEELANKNVSYIAFLDGVLFNTIFGNVSKTAGLTERFINTILEQEVGESNKILSQEKAIFKALKQNDSNYFVNTNGFIHIIKELMKE